MGLREVDRYLREALSDAKHGRYMAMVRDIEMAVLKHAEDLSDMSIDKLGSYVEGYTKLMNWFKKELADILEPRR